MNYTSVRSGGNRIFVRTSDGANVVVKNTQFAPDLYMTTRKQTNCKFKTISGELLEQMPTHDIKDARAKCFEYSDLMPLYAQPNIAYEYIRKQFRKPNILPITKKDVYGLNWDIETGRDDQGYSPVDEARCPITGISAKDSRSDRYRVWSTKELDGVRLEEVKQQYLEKTGFDFDLSKIVYIQCEDEKDLLLKFHQFWTNEYPDYLTGWNITGYDIPYYINRLEVVFGPDIGTGLRLQLSPFGSVYEKELRHYNKISITYDIVGINDLDLITLYKKFTYGGQESYTLEHIGFAELKRTKLDYSEVSNLQNLFDQDFSKFVFYNVLDVNIVDGLDDKLKLVDLVMSLAYKTGANWTDMISPVKTWDVLIYNTLADNNIMIPFKVTPPHRESYVGAYVKEPVARRYRWILSFDLNSLYPHLQMQYNLSPDRFIPHEQLPAEVLHYINQMPHETVHKIDWMLAGNLDNTLFKKHDISITPNGQCWKRGGDGFIPKILNGLYAERSQRKQEMLSLQQQIEDGFIPEADVPATKNEIARLNTLQMALKILMNSEYGAMANEYFRHFSLEIAEAITSSGQLAIRWAGNYLNDYMNKICATTDKEYVFYMDTDSLYVEFDTFVEKYNLNQGTLGETTDILNKVATDKIEPEIERIYKGLALYTNAHNQKMVMKREVIADQGVWTAKKRYALNVHDSEHVRYAEPKIKIMGLESVRSSIPQPCRDAYKEAVKLTLTQDESTVQNYVAEFEDHYRSAELMDIAFPRGVNNIEKWIGENGMPISRCPIHVRASIVFNKFIDDHHITDIEKIKSGDKIKYVYLKDGNPLRSHVVGFPSFMPQDLKDIILKHIDYRTQFEKSFLTPISNFVQVVKWNPVYENTLEQFFV